MDGLHITVEFDDLRTHKLAHIAVIEVGFIPFDADPMLEFLPSIVRGL